MMPEPPIQLRDAREDEMPRVRTLTFHAYAEYQAAMTPEAWTGLKNALDRVFAAERDASTIVALNDGLLVGSVLLYPAKSKAYGDALPALDWPEVRLLAVEPAMRGRGIAKALMAECIRRAAASGAAAIGIHTSRSMRVAMAMYREMGFLRAPEYDFQPPGAERVEAHVLPLAC